MKQEVDRKGNTQNICVSVRDCAVTGQTGKSCQMMALRKRPEGDEKTNYEAFQEKRFILGRGYHYVERSWVRTMWCFQEVRVSGSKSEGEARVRMRAKHSGWRAGR